MAGIWKMLENCVDLHAEVLFLIFISDIHIYMDTFIWI